MLRRFPDGRYVEYVRGYVQITEEAFIAIVANRSLTLPSPPPSPPPSPSPPSAPPPLPPPCIERAVNGTDTNSSAEEVVIARKLSEDSLDAIEPFVNATNDTKGDSLPFCDDVSPPPPPAPHPPPPNPPPPTGLAALTHWERAAIEDGLKRMLTNVVRTAPISKYTRISRVTVEEVDYNYTLRYSIFGACPVIAGLLAHGSVAQSLQNLGLHDPNTTITLEETTEVTTPTCKVLEYGAPAPPPSPPPPPSQPPATVRVDASVNFLLTAGGQDLRASDVFAREAFQWALETVAAARSSIIGQTDSTGQALTAVTLSEDASFFFNVELFHEDDLFHVISRIETSGREVMCTSTSVRNCKVKAALPSPPAAPPPTWPPFAPLPPLFPLPPLNPLPPLPPILGRRDRQLQLVNGTSPPLPPRPPPSPSRPPDPPMQPPLPPGPPPASPSPPASPTVYSYTVTLVTQRKITIQDPDYNLSSMVPAQLSDKLASITEDQS